MLTEERYGELARRAAPAELERAGRQAALAVLDDLWADYLANVGELKSGVHWVSWAGKDPLHRFLTGVQEIYSDFQQSLPEEIEEMFERAEVLDGKIRFQDGERLERGATWTYITTDQPFGTLGERIMKGLRRKFSRG
jgi:preprotein translocase subunit SecA